MTRNNDPSIELRVTFNSGAAALAFVEALTGNDDDVVLAAERAVRDRLSTEDVEFWIGARNVSEYDARRRLLASIGDILDTLHKPRRADDGGPF